MESDQLNDRMIDYCVVFQNSGLALAALHMLETESTIWNPDRLAGLLVRVVHKLVASGGRSRGRTADLLLVRHSVFR